MEDGMEGAGKDGRDPRGGDLGQAKEQIPPPTDLLAEEDNRRDERAHDEIENATGQAGTEARKANDPEGSGHAEAHSTDQHRPDDSDQQASSPSRMESDRRHDGTSLTARYGKRQGEREPEHRRGDSEKRCDAGVR